jgi:hypothetical protein
VAERALAVDAEQQVSAGPRDAPELGEPEVLGVLVDVGEDAAREHEVEVGVGKRQRRVLSVALEASVRKVRRCPLERVGIDVGSAQLAPSREPLQPHDDAATHTSEVQDAVERIQRTFPRRERRFDLDRADAPRFPERRLAVANARHAVLQLVGRKGLLGIRRVDVRRHLGSGPLCPAVREGGLRYPLLERPPLGSSAMPLPRVRT